MEEERPTICNRFFELFDLLHEPVTIPIKQRYFYKTSLGGIITILNILFIIIYSSFMLNSIIKREEYTILMNESLNHFGEIDLSQTPFAFVLTDTKHNIIEYDPRLFYYEIIETQQLQDEYKNKTFIERIIKFDYCKKYKNFNEEYKILLEYITDNIFCIIPNQNLTIYGKNGDINTGYKGFKIYVNKCSNNTNYNSNNRNDCYDLDFINNKLSEVKLEIIYVGVELNHFHQHEIVKNKLYTDSINFSSNIIKKFYHSFKKGSYIVNDIMGKKEKYPFFIYDKLSIDVDNAVPGEKSENVLGFSAYNGAGIYQEYNKKYENLSDIFAKIGGMCNIVLSISRIVNKILSKRFLILDIYYYLINERYKRKENIKKPKERIDIQKGNIIDFSYNKEGNKRRSQTLTEEKRLKKRNFIFRFKNNNKTNADNSSFMIFNKRDTNTYNLNIIKNNINNKNKKNEGIKITMTSTIFDNKRTMAKSHLLLFYICPFSCIKNKKTKNICYELEKEVFSCFSIENFLKLIVIEKNKEKSQLSDKKL